MAEKAAHLLIVDDEENIRESDIVYFKLKDSPLDAKWVVGKVENVIPSRDKKIRTVEIGYKYDSENGERVFKTVERPVRQIVKLMEVNDTSLLDDIKNVKKRNEQNCSATANFEHLFTPRT